MRQHGRVYDKKYLVMRHDVFAKCYKTKDKEKLRLVQHRNYGEEMEFNQALFNKFCSKNFEELGIYFFSKNVYKADKPYIMGPYNVGYDMLEDELGLIRQSSWDYYYYKIPRENKELVDFFTSWKFSFNVKTVQTI